MAGSSNWMASSNFWLLSTVGDEAIVPQLVLKDTSNAALTLTAASNLLQCYAGASLKLADYVKDDTCQNGIKFSSTGGALPAGASLSNDGTLIVASNATTPASAAVNIATINGWCNRATLTLQIQLLSPPVSGIPPVSGPIWTMMAKTLAAGSVSTWDVFQQPNSARQPVCVTTGGFNGGAYVQFVRANQRFMYATNQAISISSGFTYFLIQRWNTPVNAWERVLQCQSTADNVNEAWVINRYDTQQNMTFHFNRPGLTYATPASQNFTNGQWYVYSYRYNATNNTLQIRRNNSTIHSVSPANVGPLTYTMNCCLGANSYGVAVTAANSGFGTFDLGAFIVYDKALTDAEMDSTYAWLAGGGATSA
jgi:hypothetical protein